MSPHLIIAKSEGEAVRARKTELSGMAEDHQVTSLGRKALFNHPKKKERSEKRTALENFLQGRFF